MKNNDNNNNNNGNNNNNSSNRNRNLEHQESTPNLEPDARDPTANYSAGEHRWHSSSRDSCLQVIRVSFCSRRMREVNTLRRRPRPSRGGGAAGPPPSPRDIYFTCYCVDSPTGGNTGVGGGGRREGTEVVGGDFYFLSRYQFFFFPVFVITIIVLSNIAFISFLF